MFTEDKYTASIVWNWIWSLGRNNTRHFCQKRVRIVFASTSYNNDFLVNGEYKPIAYLVDSALFYRDQTPCPLHFSRTQRQTCLASVVCEMCVWRVWLCQKRCEVFTACIGPDGLGLMFLTQTLRAIDVTSSRVRFANESFIWTGSFRDSYYEPIRKASVHSTADTALPQSGRIE